MSTIFFRENKTGKVWHVIAFICHLFLSGFINAQTDLIISTESFSTGNGLSDNFVTSIVQDKKGFLYVGTWSGINRFDGYSFIPVKPVNDDFENFSEDVIHDLYSNDDNLWICSQSGFYNYNLLTGIFYKNNFQDTGLSYVSNSFTKIYPSRDSLFWLVRDTMIVLAGPGRKVRSDIFVYKKIILESAGSGPQRIIDLHEGVLNELWVGTSNALHCLKISNDTAIQYLSENSIFLDEPVEKIEPVNENNYWIIHSENKISKLNIHRKSLDSLRNLQTGFQGLTRIVDFEADNNGGIWIVNYNEGIHRYDLKTSTYSDHLFDRLDKIENLYENNITRLYKDHSGCIWACTRGGLAKISVVESSFNIFTGFKKKVNLEPPGDTGPLCFDQENYIWAHHWLDGPYRLEIKESGITDATPGLIKKYHSGSALKEIHGIFIPKKHSIWFCTLNGHGILEFYFDGTEERLVRQYKMKHGLPSDSINLAFRDSKNNIWVGTTKGIALFNPGKGTFISRINNSSELFEYKHNISAIEQSKSNLWFGTMDGFLIRHQITDGLTNDLKAKDFKLTRAWIMSIKQSGDSVLWLGTMSGLYKFDINSEKLEEILKEGQPFPSVAEIQIGKDGKLWLGTLTGMVRFDPVTRENHNFYAGNGISINHINWRSSALDSKGNIYFGTKAGIIYFDPENVIKYTHLPTVVISRFLVGNTPWPIEQFNSEDEKYEYSIDIPSNRSNLSFEFTALSYINQDKNQYLYRLSGLNDNWISADYRGRTINYTNLQPGHYTFEVKASNYEGIWNPTPLKINIKIKQVIWKSKLAILLYIVFISLITYIIILENRLRKKLKEELLLAKLERKNIEEINELKLHFFTNITHEFRSPLTMIINPVDKLIANEFRPAMKKELYRIKENTSRVLNLINQILDFRKVTVKGITPYFQKGDIEIFINKQISTYKIANPNYHQLIFRSELADTNFVFDSFILEKIISNLISNAVKFSPAGEKIMIRLQDSSHVKNQNQPEGIVLSVTDKGRGIPHSRQAYVCK